MTQSIWVVGSVNMDYVVQVERFPAPGETLLGSPLEKFPGGKGANQACAVARLSMSDQTEAHFAGSTGDDEDGRALRASLLHAGVLCDALETKQREASGSAMILRAADGQNVIVVSLAANFSWGEQQLNSLEEAISTAGMVLLQMEIPLEINQRLLQKCRAAGVFSIFDPAPAQRLKPELFSLIDLLTPNETEICVLLGEPVRIIRDEELPQVADRLLALGARAVLLKLGARGSYYKDAVKGILSPAYPVHAVDSTAAGDTFNGALAIALVEGRSIEQAMTFANAAAACSTRKRGAQSSIPSRRDVETFVEHIS